ncbi:MAG TPA: hypothetical protein VNI20_09765, partial [Fimbriimonadaceae bacterium]|nr:hypothetical protein [Fimbriimonadaceae bacterium]
MLGALILIAQTAQARDFDHAGAPVQRVIEQIAKAYGEKAKADGTLSRDYLILDLRNETFERAKSLIAKTLNASWQQDKHGTWILHRSKQQEQQDEHKEYEARVAAIKRYQAAIKVPARLNGRITEDFITQVVAATTLNDNKQMSDLFQRSPANRALDRLSKELDPEFLASLPTSGVVLLSAYDTVGTIAMPKAARDIIGEALADQNALADVMDIKAGSVKRHFQFSRLADDRAQTYIVVSGATGMPESLSLPLKSGQGSLEVSGGALLMQIDPDRPPLYTWPDSLKSPLVLSDQAREFNRLRPLNFSSSAQVTKPSDALLSYFLDTQDNDVYDLVVGAAVRQAADAEHKSYVVSASATMLGQGMRLSRKTQWTLRDALTILFPPEFADVQRTESAVTIRPTMPVSSRAAEYDRADFARALNSLEHRDKNAVEPVSAVAFESSGMYSRARSWLSYLSR